jgi:oligopeptide transport system substrate-binding protein
MNKFTTLAIVVMALAVIAVGCGGATPAAPAPAPTGAPVIQTVIVGGTPQVQIITATPPPTAAAGMNTNTLYENFGATDVPTIDPSLATDTTSVQVDEEFFGGLTRANDDTAAPDPNLATKWDISPDGKTFTFHMRNDVPWVKYNQATQKVEEVMDDSGNPRMVNAFDVVYGTKRTLDPRTASQYAYVLTYIQGADAFNGADTSKLSGAEIDKLGEAVGVRAVDTYTVEFTTKDPSSFFTQIAGMWVNYAEPSWLIDAQKDRWTEPGIIQTYGPYTLKEWVHDDHMVWVANPFYPGTDSSPKPTIQNIYWYMLDATPAQANYESGKLDVNRGNVPLSDIDRIKADPVMSKELRITPGSCTYYYGFNVTKKPFDNQKVRLAFSEAIDRQSLVDNVTKGGQIPAQWFALPGLNASPTLKDYPDLGVKYNPDDAKKLLADAGFANGAGLPPITLAYNTNEGHKAIAEAIAQMWKDNLGVQVQVTNQEWKVYLKTLTTDSPQIYRLGWCYDYPDANNFDREVFRSDSTQNNTHGVDPAYDKLVDQAALETDTKKREAIYAQAEDLLVNKDAFIAPIYWYTTVELTKPYVHRTYPASTTQHYEKWTLDPHPMVTP